MSASRFRRSRHARRRAGSSDRARRRPSDGSRSAVRLHTGSVPTHPAANRRVTGISGCGKPDQRALARAPRRSASGAWSRRAVSRERALVDAEDARRVDARGRAYPSSRGQQVVEAVAHHVRHRGLFGDGAAQELGPVATWRCSSRRSASTPPRSRAAGRARRGSRAGSATWSCRACPPSPCGRSSRNRPWPRGCAARRSGARGRRPAPRRR